MPLLSPAPVVAQTVTTVCPYCGETIATPLVVKFDAIVSDSPAQIIDVGAMISVDTAEAREHLLTHYVPDPPEEPVDGPPMPEETGWYLDKDGALWHFDAADLSWHWHENGSGIDRSGNEPMTDFAPFAATSSPIAPEPEASVEVEPDLVGEVE